ncbi:MAG: tRNA (adenosine(37)-N6)-dimethylallyltransferase MiaA [Pseudomonadota bacterium]
MLSLIIIAGPTGVGKTEVALEIAERLGAEIVSADSMQVYKRMDIGTAKPTKEQQSRARHHMIDVIEPGDPFNAALFCSMAWPIIDNLCSSNRPALVAGGTGLYIKALTKGVFSCPGDNIALRNKLKAEVEANGLFSLFERLRSIDPLSASRIHPNDTYRIIRALEVFELTGCPISEHHDKHGFSKDVLSCRVLKIGLTMDRERLYQRINQRVDVMIGQGLIDEVKGLMEDGFSPKLKSMQSIGYSHAALYLAGGISLDDMLAAFKRDTRRYAKRQLTWFRKDPEIVWKGPDEVEYIWEAIDNFING